MTQRLSPKDAMAKALALHRGGYLSKAATLYGQLDKAFPRTPEVEFRLAQIALTTGAHALARKRIESALKAKPKEAGILSLAADIYAASNLPGRVERTYDTLAKLSPGAIKPLASKALYLQTIGQTEKADRILRKLIERHPDEGELYRMLAIAHRFTPDDPLIAQMKAALARMEDPKSRWHVSFALAKAAEDTAQVADVFPHLKRANDLQREAYPSQFDELEAERTGALAAQTTLPAGAALQTASPTPIFVTGLPRSGTTLVERILSAHSDVSAGGELGHALRLAFTRFGAGGDMTSVPDIATADLEAFARDYRDHLRGAGVGPYITDKSIKSELVFGLLHVALPDARFVVVQRDPRDIALSIYKNHFEDGRHRYATDLAEIARTIHAFRATIAHWRRILPEGTLHQIAYEDLVADPQVQTRALIDAVGLDWQESCLSFHTQKTSVKTLSLAQVRQPIHAGRKEAWRRYEADLAPFIETWEALQNEP